MKAAYIVLTDCIQCERCAEIAPDIIGIDSKNEPYWKMNPSSDPVQRVWCNPNTVYLDAINDAINECSTGCISLEDYD
ncbi:MAG: hypothetical protein A2X19_03870 [Bacteroidetes bacterium GWE2_39_28]|nr:MAG: hypothetical protein A2X19_03870 [Bacteroidetes bacterium GWE2_39_28]OFY14867.1 MAG: hypothetical protein A2X16_09785 [Bacteroidetes bacterium GWF2_39_10]OFZ07787.1 MAG: hypothetical protein A2322_00050 [Bacteroidetes bacterium RIFOXYB2_FULL_39_7]OFZ10727.1 MAG: hypothetical protein A2465_05185 [Bacteroidetes bacterium RIFOXYC2_FULL_39_11]HCT93229.1 hypothetical protein [Rikenellaceae bacterium]